MPSRTLSEQEFNAIRDQVIAAMPKGYSEGDFTRQIGPRLDAAIAEAENKPATAQGGAVSRFVSNAAEMLNPVTLAAGMSSLLHEPITTVRTMAEGQIAQGQQAKQAAKAGNYSEAAGHGAAALVPILGPPAAQAGEQIAAGDIAGGMGRGAGLLVPAVGPAAVRGLRDASPAGLRASIAETLSSKAADQVADVMAPKVGKNKTTFGGMADRVAPTIAADPEMTAMSRQGLHSKVEARLAHAEAALDTAQDARLSARTFATQPLIDQLLEKRRVQISESVDASKPTQNATTRTSPILDASGKPISVTSLSSEPVGSDVVPAPNRARVAQIDQAIAELRQLGPAARYESLRRIRAAYDGPAKAVYNPSITADFLTAQGGKLGAADVTGVLRDGLAKMDPQTATANADYSLWRTADDVLKATAEVERTRPTVGRRIIARMAGTILGEQAGGTVGALAGYTLGPVVDSVASSGWTTQLKTAQIMTKLAKAIRAGDEGAVASATHDLRRLGSQAVALTGRATSPSGSQNQTPVPAQ